MNPIQLVHAEYDHNEFVMEGSFNLQFTGLRPIHCSFYYDKTKETLETPLGGNYTDTEHNGNRLYPDDYPYYLDVARGDHLQLLPLLYKGITMICDSCGIRPLETDQYDWYHVFSTLVRDIVKLDHVIKNNINTETHQSSIVQNIGEVEGTGWFEQINLK